MTYFFGPPYKQGHQPIALGTTANIAHVFTIGDSTCCFSGVAIQGVKHKMGYFYVCSEPNSIQLWLRASCEKRREGPQGNEVMIRERGMVIGIIGTGRVYKTGRKGKRQISGLLSRLTFGGRDEAVIAMGVAKGGPGRFPA